MEKLIRIIEVTIRKSFNWLRASIVPILITAFFFYGIYHLMLAMKTDRTAKVQHFFAHDGDAKDKFYKSYEKDFVKESQATINEGLEHWVDQKMFKAGYIKYDYFFYLDGAKLYYDELPKDIR